MSDVWLDHPDTIRGLRKMFDHCMENSFIPRVMVLCGNFSRRGIPQADSREARQFQGKTSILSAVPAKHSGLFRTRGRAGRPNRVVSPHYSYNTLRLGPWSVGHCCQFGTPSMASVVFLRYAAKVTRAKGSLWDQPVPNQVL